MDRTPKRAALAIVIVGVVMASAFSWVRYARHQLNTDVQLDIIVARRPGLRVNGALRSDVRAFYDRRDLAPVWVTERSVTIKAAVALDLLDRAVEHGLNPADYDASVLRQQYDALAHFDAENTATPDRLGELTQFDVRLTSALLSLGHDVSVGRTPPSTIDPRWVSERTPPDLARTLASALSTGLGGWLDAIQPRHAEYAALRAVLADPDALAESGDDHAAAIVAANMERWRWTPDDFGARHLYVNIPSYTLVAREDGRTTLSMRVAVGKPATNETPVISSTIATLVFRPTWGIPASIAKAETIPALLRDPDYLRRQNIDVLRPTGEGTTVVDPATLKGRSAAELRQLFYRQRSGAGNALGLVKFLFRNSYDVYLHDTPTTSAFAQTMRAVSHGCVRLEHPEALAEYVLNGENGWTGARVKRAMNAGPEQFVRLPSALPVHLVYFTAMVDSDGVLRILPDIYGIDARQISGARPVVYPVKTFRFGL